MLGLGHHRLDGCTLAAVARETSAAVARETSAAVAVRRPAAVCTPLSCLQHVAS
jgi:hypothetical protein